MNDAPNLNRRQLLQGLGLASAGLALVPGAVFAGQEAQLFANGTRPLVNYPQKRPMMLITARPPHLETPFSVFNESLLTPNDAFFVRYNLANIPTSIDATQYRLTLKGQVERPLSLSLEQLKQLGPAVELTAVQQCSGNSRGFSSPRVFGSQLGHGSMGNARWTGLPLRTLLEHAGVKAGARQVSFQGMDRPVLEATPAYIKALDIDHALSPEPMLAWAMNGEDLPFLNGYPLKLIVPGYFATYWIKHLNEIEVLDHTFAGAYMKSRYRIPDNDCECTPPGASPERTRPIGEMKVRSFITSLKSGDSVALGQPIALRGIAFDGGSGIAAVDLSDDGGKSWQAATLAADPGRFAFRQWTSTWTARSAGPVSLQVRARSQRGEIQPSEASWNPSGYSRNVIETLELIVV
ncbi:oxidase [Pseudomonas tructae]|uniref:Oxidase n=1 Tax=Pseudomonas tructae TaxID=2518644 RepID=A0A411MQ18_9PSED|nr:molybdopterin-dependent oxidoreductase [Pseudomonas tructae]QBF28868.1 oxidase [Pseudomonas tructae]